MKMYEELLQNRVIPEIKQESVDELESILQHLDEKVDAFDRQIKASDVVSKRKSWRSECKLPKQ